MTNKLGNAHQQYFCKECGWIGCPKFRKRIKTKGIQITESCPICRELLYRIGKLKLGVEK